MNQILIIFLFLALCFCQCHSTKPTGGTMTKKFDIEGHRGCRGLMPENTIPAMLKALQIGVNTLEMDAIITRDKKVILSHEPFFSSDISTTPERKTFSAAEEKQYNLYQMDYSEIRKWDVGLKPYPRFPKQEKMAVQKPLLSDVIDSVEFYCNTNGLLPVQYNIETKSAPSGDGIFHPLPEEFVHLLMQVIESKNIGSRVIIQSFDPRTLQVIHKEYPGIRTALLVEGFDKRKPEDLVRDLGFKPSIYSPEYLLVNNELIQWCKKEKILLIPWTVNDTATMKKLVHAGVDGLITDYPNLFPR